MKSILSDLNKAVLNFINQGNDPKDCKILLSFHAWHKLQEAIYEVSGFKPESVKNYMDFKVEISSYLPPEWILLINDKELERQYVGNNFNNFSPYTDRININE